MTINITTADNMIAISRQGQTVMIVMVVKYVT